MYVGPSMERYPIPNTCFYQQQCEDMSARCLSLMVSLKDSSQGLEGSKVVEIADEIEVSVISPP